MGTPVRQCCISEDYLNVIESRPLQVRYIFPRIIPTDRDVSVALYTASGTAIGVMLTLILIYIPR